MYVDAARGSVFELRRASVCAFWDVGQMATWLTRLVSKTHNPRP